MRQFDTQAARLHLRVVEYLIDAIHRVGRHHRPLQCRQPFRRRTHAQPLLQIRHQFAAMGDACIVGRITRIACQLRFADHLTQPRELAVVADRQHEITVGRRHHLVRHDVRMRRALPRRHHAADQVVRCLVGQPCHLRIQQRQINLLANAGALCMTQRGEDGGGGVHAGHQIGRGHADFLRAGAG
ncbi:hypothetical protein D3C71_1511870 [compost metagenome]